MGVVFGDLGTSPLYALQECFRGPHAVEVTRDNVLGVVSLFIWSLVLVVSVKYLVLIMRADNQGEGGILALVALLKPVSRGRGLSVVVGLGLFGAALLYGDGLITPAISVLSAVEGLKVATPVFEPYVVSLTVGILLALFFVQPYGTGRVGVLFGPILATWFVCIALLGAWRVVLDPEVLAALNPWHAVRFYRDNGWRGFPVLGAVILCLTGTEALYADMGHFGRRPIRLAWFALALPALVLSYMAQGALLLRHPEAADAPFFRSLPGWALYPMVGVATLATVVASQALIAAVASLTRQAVQLGYSPRLHIVHTSSEQIGQIYLPTINWMLMAACITLVLTFRSSGALAAAFGLAVAGTMSITTVLFALVARQRWRWSLWAVAGVAGSFLALDLAFLGANLLKVADGGWLPLVLGAGIFTLMHVWQRGRQLLAERYSTRAFPVEELFLSLSSGSMPRVHGTAVFMSSNPHATPVVLLHHLKHNQTLHERVVLLTVLTEPVPYVRAEQRVSVEPLNLGFTRVVARYGFMEDPDVPRVLEQARALGLHYLPAETTFYLGRETILPRRERGMPLWAAKLYGLMQRNARPATDYFRLPPNRVVELGAHVEL
jgi:KUP system potassium uptake protein